MTEPQKSAVSARLALLAFTGCLAGGYVAVGMTTATIPVLLGILAGAGVGIGIEMLLRMISRG